MVIKTNTKKIWLLALYTSPVISAITVTPLFIVTNNRQVYYPLALLIITGVALALWAINIWLGNIFGKGHKNDNVKRYFTSYTFCVIGTTLAAQHAFGSMHGSGHIFFHFHLIAFFAINTVILILQDLLLLKEKNIFIQQENMRLKLQNIEALNLQLQQQVQPHFLFNSLSTLKALIKVSPANAEDYLVKLSGFLRYAIAAGQRQTATVAEEVQVCTDYLYMQQIRFGQALQFSVNIPAEIWEEKLPVFALQMLAENAIKHNTLTQEKPLIITITYSSRYITVSNNLQLTTATEHTGGTGLANLTARYNTLPGGDVIINKTSELFAVSIKVLP